MNTKNESKQDYDSELEGFFILTCLTFEKKTAMYPTFRIRKDIIGYYSTVEEAEQSLSKYEINSYFQFYGFVLEEKPLNKPGCTDNLSVRTYLSDKRLFTVDVKNAQARGEQVGTIQMIASKRFNVGDLVEVYEDDRFGDGEMVRIGIVKSTPGSVNCFGRQCDYYEVLGSDGKNRELYTRITGSELFPPRLRIPEFLEKALRHELKLSLMEDF